MEKLGNPGGLASEPTCSSTIFECLVGSYSLNLAKFFMVYVLHKLHPPEGWSVNPCWPSVKVEGEGVHRV